MTSLRRFTLFRPVAVYPAIPNVQNDSEEGLES